MLSIVSVVPYYSALRSRNESILFIITANNDGRDVSDRGF